MEEALILAALQALVALAPTVPIIAQDVITLGQLLFHAQTGTQPAPDLVKRGMAIQRMLDAVKTADGLKQL